jgi:hypothetical protein
MRFLVSFICPQDGSSYNASGNTGENCGLGRVLEAANAAAAAAAFRDTWNPQSGYPFTTQIRVIAADAVQFFPLEFAITVDAATAYAEPPLP